MQNTIIIPQFANTNDAIAYGRLYKGSRPHIAALKRERRAIGRRIAALTASGDESAALYLASGQSQFVREACEAAQGAPHILRYYR